MTSQPKLHVPNPAAWVGRIWDQMPAANGETCLKGWTHAFGLKDQDPRVFEAVGCFLDMGKRAEAAVTALRGLPDKVQKSLLGWTPALHEITHLTAANAAWSNIRGRFTEVRREKLRQCEEWLDEQMWTASETRTYLDSLLQDVEKMRVEVLGADLDEDFRHFLLDILEALRRAIAEYEIRGSQGVFTSLGEILALRSRYPISEAVSEGAQVLIKKAWALTKKVAIVGSTTVGLTKTYQIGQDIYGFLTGP